MKLSTFPLAERAIAARRELIRQRDDAKLGVTIDGRYQDDEMVAAVRPVIVAALDHRIAELDEDLESYGVQID